MKTSKINKAHPELRKGEILLINSSNEPTMEITSHATLDSRSDWNLIRWKTKRRGVVAYDINGRPVKGLFPVFVQKKELKKNGINPDTL